MCVHGSVYNEGVCLCEIILSHFSGKAPEEGQAEKRVCLSV